jgi:putative FmdB family regulatory protein
MPLYEYQCENCGKVFELIQKFSDEPTAIHQQCGGKVHRLISAPALHFKGSGWYVTDYAKGGTNNPANGGKQEGEAGGKDKDGASKDSASSASSSDSSKSEGSKSEGSKSETSKSDSSKSESPKPSSTPTTTASSTSSDKK